MVVHKDNLLRCSRLFELIGDELFLILAETKPFSLFDIRRVLKQTYSLRYPYLASYLQGTFLAASGMDALSNVIFAAHNPKVWRTDLQIIDHYSSYVEV